MKYHAGMGQRFSGQENAVGHQLGAEQQPDRLLQAEPFGPSRVTNYGEYDASGVDVSLLRYLLSLSPLERLTLMEQHARDTLILFEYGRRHREAKAAANR